MKVLKFGADWCSGCLVMKPRWEEVEKENTWLQTEYFDVDKNETIAKKYDITDYPCAIFLDNDDKEIERIYGEASKKEIEAKIEEHKDK